MNNYNMKMLMTNELKFQKKKKYATCFICEKKEACCFLWGQRK